ncbi:MAG: metalloregulator ArsR/SmtB family transcription factor [bacterium]|nr:metalloregulator ArsR/SmtB family transcription factor [bacterium]
MSITIFDLHADVFKVLANPKRLEIVHLIREKELTVGELEEMLDMRQANISQHLMVLRENNLVKTRREGTYIYYSLTDSKILKASDLIREVLQNKFKGAKHITGLIDDDMKLEDYLKEYKDPVCGMMVSAKTAADNCKHGGEDYFFCARGCKEKFVKDPNTYLSVSNVILRHEGSQDSSQTQNDNNREMIRQKEASIG